MKIHALCTIFYHKSVYLSKDESPLNAFNNNLQGPKLAQNEQEDAFSTQTAAI
jgi:hypothetical protein